MVRSKRSSSPSAAPLGFEAQLWQAADALRGTMDAVEYKHVVLGLISLKYISDAFEERRAHLLTELSQGADPEDPDEYRGENVFWVPLALPREPAAAATVRDAMSTMEPNTPPLDNRLDGRHCVEVGGGWPSDDAIMLMT